MRQLQLYPKNAKKTAHKKPPKIVLPKAEDLSLIECIEKIVDLTRRSKLQKPVLKKIAPYTTKVGEMLKITPQQAMIFSLFMSEFGASSRIFLVDIVLPICLTPFHFLKYDEDIKELEKKKLLRCINSKGNDSQYIISKKTIEQIKKNQPFEAIFDDNISIEQLMDILEEFFEPVTPDNYTIAGTEQGFNGIIDILYHNKELPFVEKIKSCELRKDQVILFLFFCHKLINEKEEQIRIDDFKTIFEKKVFFKIQNDFKSLEGKLFEKELIQNVIDNGFADKNLFCLTAKAKQEFLTEFNISTNQKVEKRKDIIPHETIVEKSLFYNSQEQEQIQTLSAFLHQQKFEQITQMLESKGMRKGFAVLLYGSPGTGKTETVMQIAKQTQRDIFWVDISQSKSMWFGESEKIIKGIFDSYKKMVKINTLAPIMLFNEADAIINTRKSISNGSSIDKTENAIQNIILQEMETLEGIMMATTNLTENLDKAFERRFLYKINFQKPTQEAKQKIWKTMIDDLQENEIVALAKNYDFSGGQIENIARKKTIQEILEAKKITFEQLQFFCNEELIQSKSQKTTIGFKIQ